MDAQEIVLIVQRVALRSSALHVTALLLVIAQLLRIASRLSNHLLKKIGGIVPNGAMPLFYL